MTECSWSGELSIAWDLFAGDTVVLVAAGELDHGTAPRLVRALDELAERRATIVLLDLSALDFLDSTGLALAVAASNQASLKGRQFAIVCSRPAIARLFARTGLSRVLTIARTREDAFARLASHAPA
jgi:anti-sigma B factor antagonist